MASKKDNQSIYDQKNAISVGNRMSVERNGYISTGIVSYIEGDIIEVELMQSGYYKPGDPVKLTVYSNNGFLILASSVLAVDVGILIVLNPPENQRLSQRRQYPRIQISDSGTLHYLSWNKEGKNKLQDPLSVNICNLSLGGIGFTMPTDPGTRTLMVAELELIGGDMRCKVEILRKEPLPDGIFLGSRIIEIAPEHLVALRGFILRRQIKLRSIERSTDQE